MGVNTTLDRGRVALRSKPGLVLVGVVGLYLLVDLFLGLSTGDVQFSTLAVRVWDGLMTGLVIGLAGIGLSMTYSILTFANFAHGDYVTAGAFSGWSVAYFLAGLGQHDVGLLLLVGVGGTVTGPQLGLGVTSTPVAIIAGLVFAGVATAGLALAIDRIVYRPLRDEGGIPLLITSIGVAFALRYLIVFVFDSSKRGTVSVAGNPGARLDFIDGTVRVSAHDLTLLFVAAGLMLGIHLLLQRTKLGKAMRAMADNEDLARISGIPTERVVTATWLIGGGLAGAGGFMLTLWKETLIFNDGWLLLLLIFAAVILGGIGSIYGAIVGGLVIGLTASLSVIWIPSGFDRAAAFVVMILILLYRPQGIFAGRATA